MSYSLHHKAVKWNIKLRLGILIGVLVQFNENLRIQSMLYAVTLW